MKKVYEDIFKWLAGSHDFDAGIELFKQVSRNTFYIMNLQRSRKQSTLEYELRKAVKGLEGTQKRKDAKRESKGQRAKIKRQTPSVADDPRLPKGDKADAQNAQKQKPKFIIRNEFPFLKRDDCPQVLKILVADMLTSHEKYVKAHGKLFEVAHKSEDVCFEVADELVDNYLVNRQIWNELEHYKKTGKLLGEHPIFEEQKKKEEAENMTEQEMEKKIKNLDRQLKYRKKRLKNNRDNENISERKEEMKALRQEIRSLKLKVQNLK